MCQATTFRLPLAMFSSSESSIPRSSVPRTAASTVSQSGSACDSRVVFMNSGGSSTTPREPSSAKANISCANLGMPVTQFGSYGRTYCSQK
jgi:hypothetical protein